MTISVTVALTGCGGADENEASTQSRSTSTEAEAAKPNGPVVRGAEPGVEVPKGAPPNELVVRDLKTGRGRPAKGGDRLTVQFAALRWNGEPFQSSWDTGVFDPFTFVLHSKPPQVIPGWQQGIPGMKTGGRRELIVPPKLIYYPGQVPDIPLGPDDTLVYVVELLGIQ